MRKMEGVLVKLSLFDPAEDGSVTSLLGRTGQCALRSLASLKCGRSQGCD